MQLRFGLSIDNWEEIRDGDCRLRALYDRHYSSRTYRDGRKPAKIAGPGEYMALITPSVDALFLWRKFIPMNDQRGINCAVFRNEGPVLSSELIWQAMLRAWVRWGAHERLYTYVNPKKVRSTNPGYCFLMAGWKRAGKTKKGLAILDCEWGYFEHAAE